MLGDTVMNTPPIDPSRRQLILTPLAALSPPLLYGSLNNPFFALCMDTHDEKKRNLAEQAGVLKELGYDGAGHLWLDNVRERLDTLDRAGLRLFQIYLRLEVGPAAKEPYDPRLKDVLSLLKGRGTTLATLMVGGRPSDDSLDARAVEIVREISGLAEPFGVRIALYHHTHDWLERVEDAIRVARKAGRPHVGVMFNLCHWLKVGEEGQMKPLLEAAMPCLFAVSINGADRGAEIKSGNGNWIQPLDRGTFDMPTFLKTLTDLGYRGPVGLQCWGIPGDARVHLARSIGAWRKLRDRLSV
jgi:sugar phosphate isomerase/epimerase